MLTDKTNNCTRITVDCDGTAAGLLEIMKDVPLYACRSAKIKLAFKQRDGNEIDWAIR